MRQDVADASFVSAAGLAEGNVAGWPDAMLPLPGASRLTLVSPWERISYRVHTPSCKNVSKHCKACMRDLPLSFVSDSCYGCTSLDARGRRRSGCQLDSSTLAGQKEVARIQSLRGGRADAFL